MPGPIPQQSPDIFSSNSQAPSAHPKSLVDPVPDELTYKPIDEKWFLLGVGGV
jgi:hypothetical protein